MDAKRTEALLVEGLKFYEQDLFEESLDCFRKLTEEDPESFPGWVHVAVAEQSICERDGGAFAGREALERAYSIRRAPSLINDLANFAKHYDRDYPKAVALYREAVIRGLIAKTEPGAGYHLAYALKLLASDTNDPATWREAWMWNEWRKERLDLEHLTYRGENVKDKIIVIRFEQGFGDQIWALRHARTLHERGATVYAHCDPSIMPLCERQPYIAKTLNALEPCEVVTDFAAMSMSLPAFCLPEGGVPVSERGYLNTGLTFHGKRKGKKRVGLCWAGSTKKTYAAWRNLPADLCQELIADAPDFEWVSLQHGTLSDWRIDSVSINRCRDFLDTARLIQSLDLVLTADTVIPHLAGALGVPTLVLDRRSGNWYGSEPRSRWYESVEHCRQHERGDWSKPKAAALEMLRALRHPA